MKLNLVEESPAESQIKAYLEANASESLAAKINDGIRVEKDGKDLIAKKTLTGCLAFLCSQVRETAKSKYACCTDEEIYGWAVHYFEEEGIEADLWLNPDGTLYKKQTKNVTAQIVYTAPAAEMKKEKPAAPKKSGKQAKPVSPVEKAQCSMFDMLGGM